jgi:hypothetical protein
MLLHIFRLEAKESRSGDAKSILNTTSCVVDASFNFSHAYHMPRYLEESEFDGLEIRDGRHVGSAAAVALEFLVIRSNSPFPVKEFKDIIEK